MASHAGPADPATMDGVDAEFAPDDPRAPDVSRLLVAHLEFTHTHSEPGDVHALGVDELAQSAVEFFSLRRGGALLGIGALRRLDDGHAELKSMHTAHSDRRQGVGRAVVAGLVEVAADRGYRRLSLETGSTPAFAPARALYASVGFVPCGPFGDYPPSPNRTFMTRRLTDRVARSEQP